MAPQVSLVRSDRERDPNILGWASEPSAIVRGKSPRSIACSPYAAQAAHHWRGQARDGQNRARAFLRDRRGRAGHGVLFVSLEMSSTELHADKLVDDAARRGRRCHRRGMGIGHDTTRSHRPLSGKSRCSPIGSATLKPAPVLLSVLIARHANPALPLDPPPVGRPQ